MAEVDGQVRHAETLRELTINAVLGSRYIVLPRLQTSFYKKGIPEWWANPSDWTIAAANCDVLGFDWYAMELRSGILPALLTQVDKPTLIGEFSFPPTYNLVRGFGVYASANAADDDAAGEAYQRWVGAAATEPTTVGTMWFQYRDEPISGRGPCPTGEPDALVCNEHYAFGAADETDRPKYALVERMRTADLCAGPQKLRLTDSQGRKALGRMCEGAIGGTPGRVSPQPRRP